MIVLRPIQERDLELLKKIYSSTRDEELRVVTWAPGQKEAFLEQQFAAQHKAYTENYPGAELSVIEVDHEPAGRFYVHRTPHDFRVIDIAVLPSFRGKGIGGELLGKLIDDANRVNVQVSIHVEIENPARRLYTRLGFEFVENRGVYDYLVRRVQ